MNYKEFHLMNESLKQTSVDLQARRQDVRAAERAVQAFEDTVMTAVANERDAANKPVYSNAELRAAETAKRLMLSTEYAEAEQDLAHAQAAVAALNAEADRLRNEIAWGIHHPADEIHRQLDHILGEMQHLTDMAALRAVKHLLAEIAIGAVNRYEAAVDAAAAPVDPKPVIVDAGADGADAYAD